MLQYKPARKLRPKDQEAYNKIKADWIESLRGADGVNGIDGKDGQNGLDGRNGKDGQHGTNGIDGKDGKDGLNGRDGKDGLNGRGIAGTRLDEKNLIIIYDDGFEENVGRVVGEDGRDGLDGMNGGVISASAPVQGGSTLPEDTILYLASIAPSTATYTGDKITLLTYDDFQDITNHTKTLAYTGDDLTQTVEGFVYDSKTWTVTIDLTYLSGVWQTKSINIVKV